MHQRTTNGGQLEQLEQFQLEQIALLWRRVAGIERVVSDLVDVVGQMVDDLTVFRGAARPTLARPALAQAPRPRKLRTTATKSGSAA